MKALEIRAISKKKICPECPSKDIGSENDGEWYCHACGYQWDWTPAEWKKITGVARY